MNDVGDWRHDAFGRVASIDSLAEKRKGCCYTAVSVAVP